MRPTSKNVMTCMYPYQIVGLGDPAQELSREANLSVSKLPIRTDADSSLRSVPISTRLSKSGTEYKLLVRPVARSCGPHRHTKHSSTFHFPRYVGTRR